MNQDNRHDRTASDTGPSLAISGVAGGRHRYFGGTAVLWVGILGLCAMMGCGTPEDVRAEVRKRIGDLGAHGGYVLAAVHNIQPDVPPENICAMFDEALGR